MSAAFISVMHCPQGIATSNIPKGKLYGFGLIGLVQSLLRKFERRGRVNTQTGNIKAMRKHGSPRIITTDKLPSYSAAFREIGIANRQLCGGRSNNRCENAHLPFRRRERAMQLFKTAATLQRFVSYQSQIYNHFNHERHLQNRQTYKQKRTTALTEWFQICAS